MTDDKKRAKVVTRRFRVPAAHDSALIEASNGQDHREVALSVTEDLDLSPGTQNNLEYALSAQDQSKPQLALVKSVPYTPEWELGLTKIGSPDEVISKLESVSYYAEPFVASQVSLILSTNHESVRTLLLEGPSGAGKSYLAKCLAKITGAELMCLSCFRGINLQNLIEYPSTLGMAKAMTAKDNISADQIMNLGIISRAFLASQDRPIILLVDELDKTDSAIDTFFLGPIQDGKVWLESRAPIEANLDNILIVFTKNFDRSLNDALLRRIQPLVRGLPGGAT